MFVISYTVIFHICLYAYDMFHILLSFDSLRDLWNVCVCVCIILRVVVYGCGILSPGGT